MTPPDDAPNASNADDAQSGDDQNKETTKPNQDDTAAARKAAIEKLGLQAEREALNQSRPQQQETPEIDDELDFEGIDKEQAKNIKAAVRKAKQLSEHVTQLADFGIQQARKVKAFEIAKELDAYSDVEDFEKALSNAKTPGELDLRAREILIELKADGSFKKPDEQPKGGKQPPAPNRQFDNGRGNAGNERQTLLDEIDAIKPDDPKAQEKLAALEKRVMAAQDRFTASLKTR